eukprot:TRINITY_DN19311_c0_g1_i1.p1 TRINITY_DN19311_c0_g1~~TRINITY_DN19311_c0_g1_i1.p1  ORF type:complete len:765 (+),score=105.47 TRINITY_DN19311_c0_g1_i1:169-2463(+)
MVTSDMCRPGGQPGWIFPMFKAEQDMHDALRAIIYGILMVYFFYGVAIIADIFMSSIDFISERKKQVMKDGRAMTTTVWNRTVATLSLMALGSSAPEISLSAVDLVKKKFHFGPLGSATIVGSAAFNLLVIVAVCILAVPSTETRKIKDLPVFYITSFFSVVAYVWLVLILAQFSVDVVDIWEALVTFGMFFLLLWVSWRVDVGDCDNLLLRWKLIDPKLRDSLIDNPAVVQFASDTLHIENDPDGHETEVPVTVAGDIWETVTCSYRTEALNSIPGYDYVETEGTLEFTKEQKSQTITIETLPRPGRRPLSKFTIVLENLEGSGAEFNPKTDGGLDSTIMTCFLQPTAKGAGVRIPDVELIKFKVKSVMEQWQEDCMEAIYCNGSAEEQAEASKLDWVCHFMGLPWKVLFMTVPPVIALSGWIRFTLSLLWIGILSAVLSDLADLVGCVMDLPEIVTSITLVALGTSMPDLFASLSAAREDPTADASIVNVTGSNAVNVFLGLGLPWTLGSIYWGVVGRTPEWERRYPEMAAKYNGAVFVVNSENLGFSVLVFIATSGLALILLFIRRKAVGGELGGNLIAKIVTGSTFIFSWVLFVIVVSWRALRLGKYDIREFMGIVGGGFVLMVALGCFTFGVLLSVWQVEPLKEALRQSKENLTTQIIEMERQISERSGEPVATHCRSCSKEMCKRDHEHARELTGKLTEAEMIGVAKLEETNGVNGNDEKLARIASSGDIVPIIEMELGVTVLPPFKVQASRGKGRRV